MIAAAGDEFAGGIFAMFVGLLLLALAILWIIFPVLVLSKFNELLKVQRAIHAALQSANTARAEIADEEQTKRQTKSSPPPLGARQVIADPTYHYAAEGEQIGPYTSRDIREFHEAGVITNDTLLITNGDTQWKPLSEFAEFTSLSHGTKET